jgi:alkanesulfonate monooxygenase SsuD/methylene tetrahydromethanopterin reductase-like flavin-dependent oxidoreductase (luciferase family)
LLSNTTTDFAGDYYTFTNAYCEPKGPQQPHPPILIGGGGEKRTMRTAAKYAQHWNMPRATPAEFSHKLGVLQAHCADVGRDPGEITASAHIWLASGTAEDIARLVDEIAAFRAAGATAAIIYLPAPLNPAVLTPLAEQLSALT